MSLASYQLLHSAIYLFFVNAKVSIFSDMSNSFFRFFDLLAFDKKPCLTFLVR